MNMPQRLLTRITSYSRKWSRMPTDIESWPYRKTPRHRSWGAVKRNIRDRLTWHFIPTTGGKIRNMQLWWPKLKHATRRLCCHQLSLHVCHRQRRPLPQWCPSRQCHHASQHPPPRGDAAEDLDVQWRSQAPQDIQFITQSHKGSGLFG